MIGEKIRLLRNQRNLTLSELAGRADVAKSYLSSIERNLQHNPSIQVIAKLAAVFDVPMNHLLASEEPKQATDIDPEWLELAKEASESGVSKEEFIQFLEYHKWRMQMNVK